MQPCLDYMYIPGTCTCYTSSK